MSSPVLLRPTEAMLMKLVQAGGRGALDELYDRLASRAYRAAYDVCHDRDCAEDAVQDAFLSMWTASSTYDASRGPVAGWAMSIVRHRASYLARRKAVTAERDDASSRLDERTAPDLAADLAARAESIRLKELLMRLPPAQREVIRLGFFEELSHEQIARRLALPPGTVKGRMRLGLRKLRTGLDP